MVPALRRSYVETDVPPLVVIGATRAAGAITDTTTPEGLPVAPPVIVPALGAVIVTVLNMPPATTEARATPSAAGC